MMIQFFNREKGNIEVEKVYGDRAIEWLYDSFMGRIFCNFLIKRFVSKWHGFYQNTRWSHRKIKSFLGTFQISLEEFLPEDSGTSVMPYSSFNNFFIRRFKSGVRQISDVQGEMPAFAEARYFGHRELSPNLTIPVKGEFLTVPRLLADERWAPLFVGGPILIARLCPVDYHRFHFPDDGRCMDHYRIPGLFHSVNPLALKKKSDIFITNERHVTILDTVNFGKLAYIEVGALCVGKIVQTYSKRIFRRGEEKGYFLFGASTVIVIGQKGLWFPTHDILENTQKGLETLVKLGARVAVKN
ncbi:MAG: phosphatidylserine decarboxylase [Bdellovibrio sp.]|nr:phosphatidylserine decarboxylase [Bdellovibrio sp.]